MNQESTAAIIGTKGYLFGRIIKLEPDTDYILGRDASQCNILLKGEKVSRVHCTIRYESAVKTYTVRDTSLNGVILDGRIRLTKNANISVKSGSLLMLGDTETEIMLG
jgi:pSer/pThr/pTyr-binding forkhead associated (FHA) protein